MMTYFTRKKQQLSIARDNWIIGSSLAILFFRGKSEVKPKIKWWEMEHNRNWILLHRSMKIILSQLVCSKMQSQVWYLEQFIPLNPMWLHYLHKNKEEINCWRAIITVNPKDFSVSLSSGIWTYRNNEYVRRHAIHSYKWNKPFLNSNRSQSYDQF